MFMDARNKAGLSREKAAGLLNVGTRTLQNYEFGFSIVPPETALRMQEVYQDPTMTAKYCSEYCPIGQIFAHRVPDNQHLCSAVLGLLKEQADVEKLREKLIEITADGIIDHHELPELERILEELMDLEKKIAEFKLHVAKRRPNTMPFNPSGSRPLYAIMLLCSLVGAGTAIAVGDPLKTVAFGMFVVIGVCGVIIGWR